MLPERATLLLDGAAADLIAENALVAVRGWIVEGEGVRLVTQAGSGQPAAMREQAVRDALAVVPRLPLLLHDPTGDPRFESGWSGGFAGVVIAGSQECYGFIEAYSEGPMSLIQAAGVEHAAQRLAKGFEATNATHAAESERGGTIVVADDDPAIRALVSMLLVRRGYTVFDAGNGLQALDAVAKRNPDLVLLDWMMPIMSGHETLLKLKSDPATRHIPVIMVTAQSGTEDKVAALEAGVQDFVTKPFDGRELVARLEQHLRWRKLLAEVPAAEEASETPAPAPEDAPAEPVVITGDVWSSAVSAAQLGKNKEALALYLHEAQTCEERKQYPRAAIAYRSASAAAGRIQNANLANKFLRLAGKMYLTWSETAQDPRAIQEGYVAAARCFLTAGNLKLAKQSIEFAHSYDATLSDTPSAL